MVPSPPPQHHHRNGDGGSSSGKASPVVSPLAGMGRALGLPSKQGVIVNDAAAAGLIGGVGPAGFNAVEVRTNKRTRERMGVMWRRVRIWSRHDEDGTDCHAR